ncbi:MAG: alkene reductase [Myxococcota bacterium]|nr:alkene reductase [Myxococcota bacterium]
MSDDFFSATRLGRIELRNRVVMAPMTRSRAGAQDEPTDVMVDYYSQRASAGMIITEGIYPSADGKGYCRTPGLVSDVQIEGWRRVCDAVHAQGGTIVAQLMHCGRVTHADNKAADSETVAPSAIVARGEMYTDTAGMQAFSEPRALRREEIAGVIDEYGQATANAYEAGFDGVELHCTSGYLPAQFLCTGTNQREDEYGGPVENRVRFPVEVLLAMAAVDGADRVGFRICPGNPFNDLSDENPEETFRAFLGTVGDIGLAYLHVIRLHNVELDNIALARELFSGPLVVNDSYKLEEAQEVVASGEAAAVAFARSYIGNPDLVERFKTGAPLARFDAKKLYTPGPGGYSDFPTAGDAD